MAVTAGVRRRGAWGAITGPEARIRANRTTSRENATDRIRTICRIESAGARRRQAGDIRLSGIHAHLRESQEWNELHRPTEDSGKEDARQTPGYQGGVEEAHARAAAKYGRMASTGDPRLLSVSCSAGKSCDAERVSTADHEAVAAHNLPSEPEKSAELGTPGGAL